MVRLNKNALNITQLEKLLNQLSATLSSASKSQAQILISDLLGPEERIMIAKRLGVILLLQQKHQPYTIAQTLKMSPSTVGRIQSDLLSGKFDSSLKIITQDKKTYQAILQTIDSILTVGGIMPRYGQRPKNVR